MAFVLRTRLSACLSVCPPLFLFTHTHVLAGKYPHPLHFHHGDTWPSMSLCCSSVLVSFLILLLSFCFVWLIMSGLSNSVSNLQSSFDFYIFNILFCCFGWFVYFPTVNFLSDLALFTAYIPWFQRKGDNILALIVVISVREI